MSCGSQQYTKEYIKRTAAVVLNDEYDANVSDCIALKKYEIEQIESKLQAVSESMERLKTLFCQTPRAEQEKLVAVQRARSKFCTLRFRIGNTSQYIPPSHREEQDSYTHKWMMYVRNARNVTKEETQTTSLTKTEVLLQDCVNRIHIQLDPSYKPNDTVDMLAQPYHCSRRGWGEFPCQVTLYFRGNQIINEPLTTVHHLRLDQTCSGKVINAPETLVEIQLNRDALSEETEKDPSEQVEGGTNGEDLSQQTNNSEDSQQAPPPSQTELETRKKKKRRTK